jgi:hypothetical protein
VAAKIEIISLPLYFIDMKSVFYLIFGFSAVVFGFGAVVGCTPATETFLRSDVSGGVLEIAATDVAAHGVMIEASSSWMFDTMFGTPHTDDPRWVSAWYDEGNPALMWVGASSRNENPEARLDTVVVVSGDGLRLEMVVRQSPLEVSFDVAPASVSPFGPRETDTRSVTVTSTIAWEWELTEQSDWLTITRADAADGISGTLTIGASPTRSLDLRRDTIVVRPVNAAFQTAHTHKIPVEQAGIDLVVESEAMNPGTFAIEIPAAGGEIPLWIYSRADWTASLDAPAERASLDVTSGPADIESGTPAMITVAANPSTEPFAFTLTLTGAGQIYEYLCTQQGAPAESGTE